MNASHGHIQSRRCWAVVVLYAIAALERRYEAAIVAAIRAARLNPVVGADRNV